MATNFLPVAQQGAILTKGVKDSGVLQAINDQGNLYTVTTRAQQITHVLDLGLGAFHNPTSTPKANSDGVIRSFPVNMFAGYKQFYVPEDQWEDGATMRTKVLNELPTSIKKTIDAAAVKPDAVPTSPFPVVTNTSTWDGTVEATEGAFADMLADGYRATALVLTPRGADLLKKAAVAGKTNVNEFDVDFPNGSTFNGVKVFHADIDEYGDPDILGWIVDAKRLVAYVYRGIKTVLFDPNVSSPEGDLNAYKVKAQYWIGLGWDEADAGAVRTLVSGTY